MFEKLKEKIEKLAEAQRQNYTIETSQFNDPIADNADWWPLKPGGANFKTHTLKSLTSSQMKYQLSTGGKAFIGLFGVIGSIVAIIGLFMLIKGTSPGFFLILFGGIFTGAAIVMYKFMSKPVLFDGTMGFVWKGKHQPKLAGNNNLNDKNLIYFNNIHAIQILSERVRSSKSTYSSYEINLVLKNGTRHNIVDHGNHAQILIDAENISAFIGKPIWDVS